MRTGAADNEQEHREAQMHNSTNGVNSFQTDTPITTRKEAVMLIGAATIMFVVLVVFVYAAGITGR
jgi:hypothetical protein